MCKSFFCSCHKVALQAETRDHGQKQTRSLLLSQLPLSSSARAPVALLSLIYTSKLLPQAFLPACLLNHLECSSSCLALFHILFKSPPTCAAHRSCLPRASSELPPSLVHAISAPRGTAQALLLVFGFSLALMTLYESRGLVCFVHCCVHSVWNGA